MPEIEKSKTRDKGTKGAIGLPIHAVQRVISLKTGAKNEPHKGSLSIQDIGDEVLDSMGIKSPGRGALLENKVSQLVWTRGGFAKYKDWPMIIPGSAVKNALPRDETKMKEGAARAMDLLWERLGEQGAKPLLFRENNTFGRVFGAGGDQPWEPAYLHRGKIYIRRHRLCMYVGSSSRTKNSLVWSFREP